MSEPMTPQADSGSVEGLRANPHRLRALLLEMATRCSVDMALWDAFSNEVLRHADQVEALSTPPPPVEGGWRPIESAPKDGTTIVGRITDYSPVVLSWRSYSWGAAGEARWRDCKGQIYRPVLWCSLPALDAHLLPPSPPEATR